MRFFLLVFLSLSASLSPSSEWCTPIFESREIGDDLRSPTPRHLHILSEQVGVVEVGGDNRGPEVERYLRSVRLGPGNPWCAAFVSWGLEQAHVETPTVRSGLARSFRLPNSIPAEHVLRTNMPIPPGTIVGWQKGNGIYGHLGVVVSWQGYTGRTIEGNTSSGDRGNQSNGNGAYERTRTIVPTNYFRIRWFTLVTYPDGRSWDLDWHRKWWERHGRLQEFTTRFQR